MSVDSEVSDFKILGKRFMDQSIQDVLIEANEDQKLFVKENN